MPVLIQENYTAKLAEYGGEKALFDPVTNIKVGARILKDYIRMTGNLGIGFGQNRDIERDIVSRNIRLELRAAFTF